MKLTLKETVRANGKSHSPKSVIDTKELGISNQEAEVLVKRGTAEYYVEPAPTAASVAVVTSAASKPAPEVTNLGLGATASTADGETGDQGADEGTLTGVVDADGTQKDLDQLTKAELQAIATSLEIQFNSRTTNEQLIAAIKAVPVIPGEQVDADSDDSDAGNGEETGGDAGGETGDQGE